MLDFKIFAVHDTSIVEMCCLDVVQRDKLGDHRVCHVDAALGFTPHMLPRHSTTSQQGRGRLLKSGPAM